MVRAVLAYQEHGVEFFQLSGQSWIGIPELSTFFDPKKRGGGGGMAPGSLIFAYS